MTESESQARNSAELKTVTEATTKPREARSFLGVHMVVIAGLLWLTCHFASELNDRPSMPALNIQPRSVDALYNYPMVVSDTQLESVLNKIRPRFSKQPAKTNFVDHALRLWRTEVEFGDEAIDGNELRDLLINHDTFGRQWGEEEPPLLVPTPRGIAVRTQEGRSTVSHVDHLLGSLAEVGTPLDFEVVAHGKEKTRLVELVQNAVHSFRLNQKEYEWTTLMLAFYAKNNDSWYSQEGQKLNFDLLCDRIIRQRQPLGVCYGQHRLYTLTILLRIDDHMKLESPSRNLLSSDKRSEVMNYLKSMTKALFANQSSEGYWDGNWADPRIPVRDPATDALSRRILATGHTLEWWAMAPDELHPPRETIVRAGQWLANEIVAMDEKKVEQNYTFLTHAARALALWRGKHADEHFIAFGKQSKSTSLENADDQRNTNPVVVKTVSDRSVTGEAPTQGRSRSTSKMPKIKRSNGRQAVKIQNKHIANDSQPTKGSLARETNENVVEADVESETSRREYSGPLTEEL